MTTNQPNPEAVEAAARALYEAVESATRGSLTWDELAEGHRQKPYPDYPHLYDAYVQRARAALSAALPLLPDVGDLLAELDRLRAATQAVYAAVVGYDVSDALATVNAHAVKPDRDTIAGILREVAWHTTDPEEGADALLALLPGRTEAQVKAEALREAADLMVRRAGQLAAEWLRARADRIERGEV